MGRWLPTRRGCMSGAVILEGARRAGLPCPGPERDDELQSPCELFGATTQELDIE